MFQSFICEIFRKSDPFRFQICPSLVIFSFLVLRELPLVFFFVVVVVVVAQAFVCENNEDNEFLLKTFHGNEEFKGGTVNINTILFDSRSSRLVNRNRRDADLSQSPVSLTFSYRFWVSVAESLFLPSFLLNSLFSIVTLELTNFWIRLLNVMSG